MRSFGRRAGPGPTDFESERAKDYALPHQAPNPQKSRTLIPGALASRRCLHSLPLSFDVRLLGFSCSRSIGVGIWSLGFCDLHLGLWDLTSATFSPMLKPNPGKGPRMKTRPVIALRVLLSVLLPCAPFFMAAA